MILKEIGDILYEKYLYKAEKINKFNDYIDVDQCIFRSNCMLIPIVSA